VITVLRGRNLWVTATGIAVRRISIVASVLLAAGCAALGIDPEMDVAPPPPRIAADTQLRLASGTWVSSSGTRVRFAIVVPPMQPGDRLPLVLALHGQSNSGDSVPPYFGQRYLESLFGPALRPLGAIIVAPDAPRNNWTEPVAEQAMLEFVAEMKRRYPIDTMRTLVTGISMGGMGTWFLASRHPRVFRAAVPLASFPLVRRTSIDQPGLDAAFDAMTKDRTAGWAIPYREVPVYAIHSRQDQSVPFSAESTLVSMIKAKGGLVEFAPVDSLRHGPAILYQGALRGAVPWIRRQWARR
jgi:predicted peptidase